MRPLYPTFCPLWTTPRRLEVAEHHTSAETLSCRSLNRHCSSRSSRHGTVYHWGLQPSCAYVGVVRVQRGYGIPRLRPARKAFGLDLALPLDREIFCQQNALRRHCVSPACCHTGALTLSLRLRLLWGCTGASSFWRTYQGTRPRPSQDLEACSWTWILDEVPCNKSSGLVPPMTAWSCYPCRLS